MPQSHPLLLSKHGIKSPANMEALLNTSVAMPCLASRQQPRAAAPAVNLSGLRRSSIKGSQFACRRPSLAKQRFVASVRAAAAVVEETKVDEKTEMLAINAIRFLSIDGVNKANSGHPGLPMGCAPLGYILYNEVMQHNPKHPKWFNRDRFVLSAGHGCMLQYSLMHLTGYDSVSVSGSCCLVHKRIRCDFEADLHWWPADGRLQAVPAMAEQDPGSPRELRDRGYRGHHWCGAFLSCCETAAVYNGFAYVSRALAGPLGQGIANAVGLAASEAHLAARFNKDGHKLVDHYTYAAVFWFLSAFLRSGPIARNSLLYLSLGMQHSRVAHLTCLQLSVC